MRRAGADCTRGGAPPREDSGCRWAAGGWTAAPASPPATALAFSSYREVQGRQNTNTWAARPTSRKYHPGLLQQVAQSSSKKTNIKGLPAALRRTQPSTDRKCYWHSFLTDKLPEHAKRHKTHMRCLLGRY